MTFDSIKEIFEEKWKLLLIIFVCIGATVFLFFNLPSKNNTHVDSMPVTSESTVDKKDASSKPANSSTSNDTIMVDIKGEVEKPDVYSLNADSRVSDLVKEAGGVTKYADPKSINLSQKLSDEMVVYVAKKGEDISVISNNPSGTNDLRESKEGSKININTADLNQLQSLSGVGAKKAQDIIDYREANGGFKNIEELQNVSGIGQKSLEKLKDNITV